MKEFLNKMPGKAEYVIGTIVGIIFFLAYRVALTVGEKWPYPLGRLWYCAVLSGMERERYYNCSCIQCKDVKTN